MCGIFGLLNINGKSALDPSRFSHALGKLHHRGPDNQQMQIVSDDLLLGHTRLSIIDLSDNNNQPFHVLDRYWLVYNGEIFNYLELREELEALGAKFQTSGDTEVLAYAYIYWGEDCVSRFNGMWSFAIYDTQENKLFCSRDRFGVKPFNYAVYDGQFYFASEIKAIIAYQPGLIEPNYNVIANFCRTSVGAQHAQTWFKQIFRLQPGHNLTICDGKIVTKRYWKYPDQSKDRISFEKAKNEFSELFKDAVKLRMRSDVPLGVTLSAGVDSNAITYTMKDIDPSPHHCFTARFLPEEGLVQDRAIYVEGDLPIDESITAKEVTAELGLNSTIVDTNYRDFVASLRKTIYHLESGNSAPAVIPLMQLLKRAKKDVTVVLEGQGADELLGGYIVTILWASIFDQLKAGKFKEAFQTLKEFSKTYTISHSLLMAARMASNRFSFLSTIQQKFLGIEQAFGPALKKFQRMRDYPDTDDSHGDLVNRQLQRQHSGGLVNLLHYGDAVSMAHSLESRMPFLDFRLVEYVFKLPSDYKTRKGVGKILLREAMSGLVPHKILYNRTKFGFSTPIGQQFKKPSNGEDGPVDVLLSDRCLARGLFDKAGLTKLIASHQSGKRDHGPLLFRLISTELWFREFIDQETPVQAIHTAELGTVSN